MGYKSGHGRVFVDEHGNVKHEYVESVSDDVPKIWRQLAEIAKAEMIKQKKQRKGNG